MDRKNGRLFVGRACRTLVIAFAITATIKLAQQPQPQTIPLNLHGSYYGCWVEGGEAMYCGDVAKMPVGAERVEEAGNRG